MKNELLAFFTDNPFKILIMVATLTPSIWGLASLYYCRHIDILKAQVNFQSLRIQFLEAKLKDQPQFPSDPLIPSAKMEKTKQQEGVTSQEVKFRYPPIINPRRLTKSEVRDLANFYNLFTKWTVNPQLRFEEGDVSYWFEKGLSEEALKREFESRLFVLQRAEDSRERIDSPGDLSNKAKMLQAEMLRR